jgi:hypothetical protein
MEYCYIQFLFAFKLVINLDSNKIFYLVSKWEQLRVSQILFIMYRFKVLNKKDSHLSIEVQKL